MENTILPRMKFGISGSTLKLIAIITMFVDHLGAAVVIRMLLLQNSGKLDTSSWLDFLVSFVSQENLYMIYRCMRNIGRISFPIFCFLLVEGFIHTSNRKKYGMRLFLFALLSEIPFDLAFCAGINWEYQNVFFTLLIGFVTMAGIEVIERQSGWKYWQRTFGVFGVFMAGMVAANIFKTDYSAKGVFCIVVLYLFRHQRVWQLLAGAVSFYYKPIAMLGFLPIALYNGKRGWKLKYFFYGFYPVHLLLLYAFCWVLGISGVSLIS